ncbi:uncharacterized protein LOC110770116 [Prunus avium]|uniref:Uncharacterized protein LOC110770116 n=1 Tax=Prunus avium TaxID=42229 RepID=A0A6P5TSD2_PRUAV|nr:uncharacterized protein LOC110770116 [Prunus avium]
MPPNRNDPNMKARLMKIAKETVKGSAGGSQPPRTVGSSHMSVAGNQGARVVNIPARVGQKRVAEEVSPLELGKRRAEGEPKTNTGKRPVSSAAPGSGESASVDSGCGPLEPWVDGELALRAFQQKAKRVLRVEVVKSMFTENMGYSGMTMSALEDQLKATFKLFVAAQNVAAHRDFDRGKRDEHALTTAELNRTIVEKTKVEEELLVVQGRLDAETKKNAELLLSVNKLTDDKHSLGAELSKSQEELGEANRKIEAFSSELRTCCDNAVKDYVGSAEYQEILASQRVEGYFDLIQKVGEKYPSLDWNFLGQEVEEAEAGADQGGGADVVMGSGAGSVIQVAEPRVQGVSGVARVSNEPSPGP